MVFKYKILNVFFDVNVFIIGNGLLFSEYYKIYRFLYLFFIIFIFLFLFCSLFVVVFDVFILFDINKFLLIVWFGVIFFVEEFTIGIWLDVEILRLLYLLLKFNRLGFENEVLEEDLRLKRLLVWGIKFVEIEEVGNCLSGGVVGDVFDNDNRNLFVVNVVEEVGIVGVNEGLKMGMGFIVILGVIVEWFLDCWGEVWGLKVIIGGLGLLFLVDLKINFVLYCGFVEGFLVFVVVVIKVVFVIVFAVVFSVLLIAFCDGFWVCGL